MCAQCPRVSGSDLANTRTHMYAHNTKHCRSYAGPLCLRGGAEVKGAAVGEHARVRVRNIDEKYGNMNAGEEEFMHHTNSAEDVKVVGVASL